MPTFHFSRYLSTFSPSTTDDAERDEVLTQKIRIFRWIKPEHLDIPDNAQNAVYLDKAQAGTSVLSFRSLFDVINITADFFKEEAILTGHYYFCPL